MQSPFSVLIAIFILLVYYQFAYQSSFELDNQFTSSKEKFSYRPTAEIFRISANNAWTVPPLGRGFEWEESQVTETDACFGKNDSLIPAEGVENYFFPRFPLRSSSSIKNNNNNSSSSSDLGFIARSNRAFYFECKKSRISQSFYCPDGTVFSNGCVHPDPCDGRTDGFKYAHDDIDKYFECEGGKNVEKQCPPGKIFAADECREPRDPCELSVDGEKLPGGGIADYRVCHGGKSRFESCPGNKYFNAISRSCCALECYQKKDGRYGIEVSSRHLKYSPSFVVCKDGQDVDRIECPPKRIKLEGDYVLPLNVEVFDSRVGKCVPDLELCGNVFPATEKKIVPGVRYRTHLPNYLPGAVFDHLYGFACDPLKEHTLPPDRIVNADTWEEDGPLCRGPNEKVPVREKDRYFDCALRQTLQCPPGSWFDYEKKNCEGAPYDAHAFRGDGFFFPVFKFDKLKRNWFGPRDLLTEDKVVCDPVTEKRFAHYNVCAEYECEKFLFLKQLPSDKRIMLDDEYECRMVNGKIKRVPYRKKEKGLKLDFWKQKLGHVVKPCSKNEPLESKDFVMNRILHKTCDRGNPFVLCPSSDTIGLIYKDKLCSPDPKLFTIRLAAFEKRKFYLADIDEVKSDTQNVLNMKVHIGSHTLRFSSSTTPFNFFDKAKRFLTYFLGEFELEFDADVTITVQHLPSNHPNYLFYRGGVKYKKFNHKKNEERQDNEEVAMETYDFEYAVTGFV